MPEHAPPRKPYAHECVTGIFRLPQKGFHCNSVILLSPHRLIGGLFGRLAISAGRGEAGGRVIIQTYMPQHYAVRATSDHDYEAFYRQEIDYRKQLNTPPFSRLIKMTYIHANDMLCQNRHLILICPPTIIPA